jgi:hypothetical protein
MIEFLKMILENFTSSDWDYLVTIAPTIAPKVIELTDLSSYESLILNKQSSEVTTWKDLIKEAQPFRQPFPNERYLY